MLSRMLKLGSAVPLRDQTDASVHQYRVQWSASPQPNRACQGEHCAQLPLPECPVSIVRPLARSSATAVTDGYPMQGNNFFEGGRLACHRLPE